MIPDLTIDALQRPRTAIELHAWAQEVHRRFGQSEEGRLAFRLPTDVLIRRFKDEVWPLAHYARRYFTGRADVRLQPVIGNQNYDAQLLDAGGTVLHYFEVTQALHGDVGHQERLRMEHLVEYGSAPLTGVRFTRDPTSRVVEEASSDFVSHDVLVAHVCAGVRSAVQAKVDKHYPDPTTLIVEIDGRWITKPADFRSLEATLDELSGSCVGRFVELAVVDSGDALAYSLPVR